VAGKAIAGPGGKTDAAADQAVAEQYEARRQGGRHHQHGWLSGQANQHRGDGQAGKNPAHDMEHCSAPDDETPLF
jgi:hypothetical protein